MAKNRKESDTTEATDHEHVSLIKGISPQCGQASSKSKRPYAGTLDATPTPGVEGLGVGEVIVSRQRRGGT